MCLDICPPADATARRARGGRAAHAALGRASGRRARARPGQLRFGIAQGGTDRELRGALDRGDRRRSRSTATRSAASRSGRAREEMLDTVGWAAPPLPADRPRYFMGLGDAEGILEVIARGIDMFDCVLPTRTARTGSALTAARPAQPPQRAVRPRSAAARGGLRLPGLRGFSRAFVRHCVNQQEILGLRLLTLHNLWFTLRLTAGARDAITRGDVRRLPRGRARLARRRPGGGTLATLILLVAMFVLLWALLIRPQRARQAEQQQVLGPIEPGDEVLTVGGIYGIVHGDRRGGRPDRRDRRRHPGPDRTPRGRRRRQAGRGGPRTTSTTTPATGSRRGRPIEA